MDNNIKATGQCWVWANGRIEFGVELPDGALPIMQGDVQQMKDLVEATARLAYPSDGDVADVWLVPGLPEAQSQNEAYEALQRWLLWISTHSDTNRIVFSVNKAANRNVRRATARKINGERH